MAFSAIPFIRGDEWRLFCVLTHRWCKLNNGGLGHSGKASPCFLVQPPVLHIFIPHPGCGVTCLPRLEQFSWRNHLQCVPAGVQLLESLLAFLAVQFRNVGQVEGDTKLPLGRGGSIGPTEQEIHSSVPVEWYGPGEAGNS